MSRNLDTITQAAIQSSQLYPLWLVRLDISVDPVYVHTGLGNIVFAANQTGDTGLDGYTFKGIANIGEISAIQDGPDGSQSVTLKLPGVQLQNDYLNQIIFKQDTWQGQRGWIWFAVANSNGVLISKPTRVKTGRMDQMPITIDPEQGTGTIEVTLESQASYSGQPLYTRYSEQLEIDPLDISQSYIPDLANKSPVIGNLNSNADGNGNISGSSDSEKILQQKTIASYL